MFIIITVSGIGLINQMKHHIKINSCIHIHCVLSIFIACITVSFENLIFVEFVHFRNSSFLSS